MKDKAGFLMMSQLADFDFSKCPVHKDIHGIFYFVLALCKKGTGQEEILPGKVYQSGLRYIYLPDFLGVVEGWKPHAWKPINWSRELEE